jgi:hypothetical protein
MKLFVFLFFLFTSDISIAQDTKIPADPGMYVERGSGFTNIIGQIAQFTRTGSRLVSHATIGIKAAKANIQLPGPHAQTVVSPQPVFYFIPPKQAAAAGVNAGDLILLRLEEKSQRRQFEIAAAGLFRASSGISLTHQVQILRSEPTPGIYMITPATELTRGEYALYLARGEGMAAYVYDFGVQGARSVQPLQVDRGQRSRADTLSGSNNPVAQESPALAASAASLNDPVTAKLTATTSHGCLGILGSDWQEQGAMGVEIVKVLEGSSAEIAGLHQGEVITDVNGVNVHSTQDLSNILSKMEPGTRVNVSYLYKSNIGWMPQAAVAILSREQE